MNFEEKDLEMRFIFRQMNEQDARAIAEWHYEGSYAFYDMDQDADDLAELLNPRSWEEKYYAVLDEQGELAGFFDFTKEGKTVEIGLGLRPDLTGKRRGVGLEFVEAGLEFARNKYTASAFRLRVATFNRRAICVYEKAGFRPMRVFMHETNGGEHEFLEMVLP
jgi:ribosomal-protein-alanine N-acetyltransferase